MSWEDASPQCRLSLFLVNLILRSTAGVEDQISVETSSTVRYIPFVQVIWVVKRTWYSPFQGDSGAIFVLSDSKSEGWEKIGQLSLESRSQLFEETRRTQGIVQFTGI